MITMARIQGSAMGYGNFQKPVLQTPRMGQNGTGVMPPGAASPHQVPSQEYFVDPRFAYPPLYNFPVLEEPVKVTPTPAPAPMPTWAIVGLSAAAGAALLFLLKK